MAEVPGSILTEVTFYCWMFCFRVESLSCINCQIANSMYLCKKSNCFSSLSLNVTNSAKIILGKLKYKNLFIEAVCLRVNKQ